MIMCPIAHVPHPPRYPISIFNITHDTPLPMCPVAHIKKDVKLSQRCQAVRKMSSCQKDVKLSKRCQMSKSQTHKTMEEAFFPRPEVTSSSAYLHTSKGRRKAKMADFVWRIGNFSNIPTLVSQRSYHISSQTRWHPLAPNKTFLQ